MGKHGQAAKTRERQLEAEVAKVKEEHQAAVEAQDASKILSDLKPFNYINLHQLHSLEISETDLAVITFVGKV